MRWYVRFARNAMHVGAIAFPRGGLVSSDTGEAGESTTPAMRTTPARGYTVTITIHSKKPGYTVTTTELVSNNWHQSPPDQKAKRAKKMGAEAPEVNDDDAQAHRIFLQVACGRCQKSTDRETQQANDQ
jgi:hypothetical protein